MTFNSNAFGNSNMSERGQVKPPTDGHKTRDNIPYWLAWLAYSAHSAMTVTIDRAVFSVWAIDPDTGKLNRDQALQQYWTRAACDYLVNRQKTVADYRQIGESIIDAAKMVEIVGQHPGILLDNVEMNIAESRERYFEVWEGIPMHKATQIPALAQRIEQPLSTYEEAVATTQGRHQVYTRRLNENAVGWPNEQAWKIIMLWPEQCPVCRANTGTPCVVPPDDIILNRHRERKRIIPTRRNR